MLLSVKYFPTTASRYERPNLKRISIFRGTGAIYRPRPPKISTKSILFHGSLKKFSGPIPTNFRISSITNKKVMISSNISKMVGFVNMAKKQFIIETNIKTATPILNLKLRTNYFRLYF